MIRLEPIINVYPSAGTPGWVNGLFIVGGAAVALMSTWLSDKRRHGVEAARITLEDRRQWDKEVFRLSSGFVAIATKILPIAQRYWRYGFFVEQEKNAELGIDIEREIWDEMEKQKAVMVELQMIAPDLADALKTFNKMCKDRFIGEHEIEEDDKGLRHPVFSPPSPPDDIDAEIEAFTSAVHAVIRLAPDSDSRPRPFLRRLGTTR